MKLISDSIETRLANISKKGLLTGLSEIDEAIWGLRPANLILIGGRTSQGKSSLATDIALNVSKTAPVAFFSLEMSETQLQLRAVCNIANLSYNRIRRSEITTREQTTLDEAVEEFKSRKLLVECDINTIYPNNLLETHKRFEGKMPEKSINCQINKAINLGCELIIIDHLQWMHYGVWAGGEILKLHAITLTLAELAKTHQIPIVLVSQLSRPDRERYKDGKVPRPRLSDLRESGHLEQDACIVILVHRPEFYKTEKKLDLFSDGVEEAELILAKNRDGIAGVTIPVKWCGSWMSFRNMEE